MRNINLIDNGKLEIKIKKMIEKYYLQNFVNLCGVIESDRVRKYMGESQIFLFTSKHNVG